MNAASSFREIQPSGAIHIGNYFGAIKQWVAGQDDAENIFCLVNMHALTVPQEPDALRRQTLELAMVLLAAGIDQTKSRLFAQSHVREHGELTWYLSCVASMGQLQRMTQFKEKSETQRGEVRAGLFTYPIPNGGRHPAHYRTTHVPVGDDQKQHVELARDIAQRFNANYGDVFVIPEPAIPALGARVMESRRSDEENVEERAGLLSCRARAGLAGPDKKSRDVGADRQRARSGAGGSRTPGHHEPALDLRRRDALGYDRAKPRRISRTRAGTAT